MHWRVWLAMVSIAGITHAAAGQEPATADAAPPASGEATAAPNAPADQAAPAPQQAQAPRGDVIHLKSGRVIEGLQVIRATSSEYILEVLEGATIRIPRRQVVSIDYDAIDPVEIRKQQEAAKRQQQATLVPGIRLSPELHAKLGVDISNPPFNYSSRDLVEILEEISKRVDGILVIDQPVRDLPAEQRVWSVESHAGQTLDSLLREGLLRAFPDLTLVAEANKIHVTTKAAAATAETPPPAPGTPPPTGSPPPAP